MAMAEGCLRTLPRIDWQAIVRELLNTTPIIVFDAQESSPAVVFEAAVLQAAGSSHKVLYLTSAFSYGVALEELQARTG
jgi:hypothetical protein